MAPDAVDVPDNEHPIPDNGNAVSTAVHAQLSLVSAFEKWLTQKLGADGERDGIISRVQKRSGSYAHWLLQVEATPTSVTEDEESWAMDFHAQPGGDQVHVIVVSGPGSSAPVQIVARDKKDLEYLTSDNYLGYMSKICHAFSDAQDTLRSLLRTASEIEQEKSQLSQPPEETVKAYIRRLREYNDMKDIGQQLIGLIAENRGVPIRTLYESGEYGVSIPH